MAKINSKAILNLAVPLTIILFILLTKWWIVQVVDAGDCIAYGFPLIYKSPAFHTSMAEQYFITELLFDLLVYFLVIVALLLAVNKYLSQIKFKKSLSLVLYIIAGLLVSIQVIFSTIFETNFLIKRDFDIEVKQTGIKFYFYENERDTYNQLHQ